MINLLGLESRNTSMGPLRNARIPTEAVGGPLLGEVGKLALSSNRCLDDFFGDLCAVTAVWLPHCIRTT